MAEEEELDEFEEQLRQEALARIAKEEGATLSKGSSYIDDDGTVMEWDSERRAYFPKIDADFIAQYQINYGAGGTQGQELSEEEKKAQYDEYWRNYYNVYTQEQPQLPKFDEEGNPVEDEDNDDDKDGKKKESKASDGKKSGSAETQGSSDPTSDEHYQYNLYYFGKEYADTYRDYYRENPDGEAVPDWVKPQQEETVVTNKKVKGKKTEEKGEKRKEPPREEGWFDTETSTQVYVSGLPTDITDEEFKDIMTKCGLIMFDPQTRQPKLKLYKDNEGNMKGDGLCTYIKSESVELALQIVDGTDVRGHTISVEMAKFEMKGDYDPKKKKKKLSNKAKQRLKERQEKLFDWRPDKNPFERGRHERTVILKNMFDIKEFEKNPGLINELRLDVREECLKFGDVKKVSLYDRNPEGVISVTFKEPEEADACIAALNGRWFAKNRVVASTFDGKTRYDVEETEEEKEKRLKEWEKFLKDEDEEEAKNASGKDAAGKKEEKSDHKVSNEVKEESNSEQKE